MPWAMFAMTALTIGYQIYQQNEIQKAEEEAQAEAIANQLSNQSRLTEEQQRQRRRSQGARGLSSNPISDEASTLLGGGKILSPASESMGPRKLI